MLLPHRTAWTTPLEFQSVYSDLFESDGDTTRQRTALSRIAVWQSRNLCPSAVESTANLLNLILLDSSPSSSCHSPRPSSSQLRLSYSMTLIRFVNSLVDPLQTAYFARSISSLATQLGLPLWFVELRHQATHEELPALPVLREGARQAIDWLYLHYWHPTISNINPLSSTSPSSSTSTLPPLPLEPFLASLNSYKSLLKSLLKDASQSGRIKNELLRVYRDLERWGTENGFTQSQAAGGKVTRKSLNPNGLAGLVAQRTRERAMETVAGVLVDDLGWLVPLAKKKRPSTRSPALPKPLIDLYSSLLEFLDETLFSLPASSSSSEDDSDSFLDTLVSKIVDVLCTPPPDSSQEQREGEREKSDPTIHLTLQAWVLHLVPLEGEAMDVETVEGIIKSCLVASTNSSIALVEAILNKTDETLPQLREKVEPLLKIVRTNQQESGSNFMKGVETPEQAERVIEEILKRSFEIEQKLTSASSPSLPSNPTSSNENVASASKSTGSSWGLVQGFKACPIGTLPLSGGGFEGLDLVR
ncbi:rRNA-processing protein LAS1 [Sporobolomyces salmoneus]|uniref:rRNA-processing protein LAS1 n=1 Tax=Sporobolomyces salmoneus TaxID=183962 RepID=UPI00318263F7